jgi:hypothetical protein
MLPWELLPGHITEAAQAYFPTNRNDITSTGAKDHANVDTILDREIPGSDPLTPQSPQLLENVNDDTSAPSRATTPPPIEDVDVTSKRLASAELPDQPDLKKLKMSTPSDGDANGAGVEETDLLSSQRPQPLAHTVSEDNTTSSATTTSPTEDSDATPKRSASVQPIEQPDLKRAMMSTPSEGDEVDGGVDEIDQPSPHYLQQLEESIADNNTTSSAKAPEPTTNVNNTPKRPASVQPTDQPDPKRFQLFIPSNEDGDGGSTVFPTSQDARTLLDNHALAQPVEQPDTSKVRTSVAADASGGGGGFGDTIFPSSLEATSTLRAPTEVPGEVPSGPEQAENAGIGGSDKDKSVKDKLDKGKDDEENIDKEKADKDKIDQGISDKEKVDGQKVDSEKAGEEKTDKDKVSKDKHDSDSDDFEILDAKSSPATGPKWKQSVAAKSALAKKNKGKQPGQLETPGAEASPSARKSAAKASNTRGKSVSQAVTLTESEAAGKEEEGEEEDDDDDDEEESGPEAVAQTAKEHADAVRALSKVCPKCKINANKELKAKHQAEISQLKRDYKAEIRALKDDSKADATAAAKKAKATAEKEKKAAKAKADEELEDVKETCGQKFADYKARGGGIVKELKNILAAERAKIAELKLQVERVEAQRKNIEKDAAEKVKNAVADCKAEELRVNEEKKQYKRELAEQMYQLKPEHSKVVKEKDKLLKEAKESYKKLELEFEASEEDLRIVREERSKEKNHHEHTLKKLEEKRTRVDELVGQLWEFERYNKAIKERALADVARVEEHLAIAKDNHQQQSNRVVEKQRHNYQLQDALQTYARLSDARKEEIEVLKKELRATQAELGIAKDMDDLDDDMVEVGRREVVKGEAVRNEVVKGEGVKDKVVNGEGVDGDIVNGEVVRGECIEGEVV